MCEFSEQGHKVQARLVARSCVPVPEIDLAFVEARRQLNGCSPGFVLALSR